MTRRQLKVLVIVLAGGEGKRLMPLTQDRAKPAVPFGGIYRLIDFALSNVVNSGYVRIVVLTQYKSHSLDRHVSRTWPIAPMLGSYVAAIPAQQRMGKSWYLGSADAIYQSLNAIRDEDPDLVVVVGADHVYRMDFSQMVDQHLASGSAVTVAAIRQPRSQADQFGVIEVDSRDHHRIVSFVEKPSDPAGIPDDPQQVLASMGNYVFNTGALIEAVTSDCAEPDSAHDMGGDIVPNFVAIGDAQVYDFQDNDVPGSEPRDRGYWRDVGTLDSYYAAHMDLISIHPIFNLYNWDWPIYTTYGPLPPAKFVHGDQDRVGSATNSVVSPGAVISGSSIAGSVIGPQVRVNSFAQIEDSVLLNRVRVGRKAKVRRAIIDKNVEVPSGVTIGYDAELDRARGFVVTDSGITVVGKGQVIVPDSAVS